MPAFTHTPDASMGREGLEVVGTPKTAQDYLIIWLMTFCTHVIKAPPAGASSFVRRTGGK